jgi:hypothetical protein
LVQVIDIYRVAAAKDRLKGQVKGVGQRDITVTIDMYLATKKKDSKGGTFQNEAIRLLPSRQAIVLPY